MNKELQCNIVNDLLPLYMDDLTSEETNSFIKNICILNKGNL